MKNCIDMLIATVHYAQLVKGGRCGRGGCGRCGRGGCGRGGR